MIFTQRFVTRLGIGGGGLRGRLMMMLGVGWVLIGLGLLTGAAPDGPVPGVPHTQLPGQLRAGLWIGTGIFAIVRGMFRGSQGKEPGVMALLIMPLFRAGSYLWAWLVHLWPLDDMIGISTAWYNATFYVILARAVRFASEVPANAPPPLAPAMPESIPDTDEPGDG